MKQFALIALAAAVISGCSRAADAPAADAKSVGTGGVAAVPGDTAAKEAERKAEAPAPVERAPDATPARTTRAPGAPVVRREIVIPAGTMLALELRTAVASDESNVEDPVRATLRSGVTVNGVQALPAGTAVLGHVTDAKQSAKVKGRGRVAFRFTSIDAPGDGGRIPISTGTIARVAPGTKKKDAIKIGGGAAGGAIIGGILGGKDGAAKGAAIGGAAGTGVVLATRGKDVRLAAGTPISVRLTAPVTVIVR